MNRYANAVGLMIVALIVCWTVSSSATSLSISPHSFVASPGQTVHLNVDYSAHRAHVASLQFDLIYDPSVLSVTTTTAGGASMNVNKTLTSNLLSPGDLRFIIAGFNQTVFGSGGIARITVQVNNSARVKHHRLFLCNIFASDPNGLAVPIKLTGEGHLGMERGLREKCIPGGRRHHDRHHHGADECDDLEEKCIPRKP